MYIMKKNPLADEQRKALLAFMEKKGLVAFKWAKDAGVAQSIISNFLKGISNSITTTTLIKLASVPKAEGVLNIFGINSSAEIDPKRLRSVSEAVYNEIKRRKLKLNKDQIYEFLVQAYRLSLEYDRQRTPVHPKVIADMVLSRGAG